MRISTGPKVYSEAVQLDTEQRLSSIEARYRDEIAAILKEANIDAASSLKKIPTFTAAFLTAVEKLQKAGYLSRYPFTFEAICFHSEYAEELADAFINIGIASQDFTIDIVILTCKHLSHLQTIRFAFAEMSRKLRFPPELVLKLLHNAEYLSAISAILAWGEFQSKLFTQANVDKIIIHAKYANEILKGLDAFFRAPRKRYEPDTYLNTDEEEEVEDYTTYSKFFTQENFNAICEKPYDAYQIAMAIIILDESSILVENRKFIVEYAKNSVDLAKILVAIHKANILTDATRVALGANHQHISFLSRIILLIEARNPQLINLDNFTKLISISQFSKGIFYGFQWLDYILKYGKNYFDQYLNQEIFTYFCDNAQQATYAAMQYVNHVQDIINVINSMSAGNEPAEIFEFLRASNFQIKNDSDLVRIFEALVAIGNKLLKENSKKTFILDDEAESEVQLFQDSRIELLITVYELLSNTNIKTPEIDSEKPEYATEFHHFLYKLGLPSHGSKQEILTQIDKQIQNFFQNLKDVIQHGPAEILISQYTSVILFKDYKTDAASSWVPESTQPIRKGVTGST